MAPWLEWRSLLILRTGGTTSCMLMILRRSPGPHDEPGMDLVAGNVSTLHGTQSTGTDTSM